MKKIQKFSFSERLSYAPLHLDDLERIVDAIKEKLPQVLFKDEEYEYESLDEMKEKLGLRVKQIAIVGSIRDPLTREVNLSIEGRRIWLRADAEYELLWHQIAAIVKGRVPWHFKLVAPWIWGWLLSMLVIQYASFIDKQTKVFAPPVWLHVMVIVSALLFAFSIWQIAINRGVFLDRRHTVKGFISRNFDRLLMLGIGGLLTLLGKFVYSWLFGGNG